MSGEKKATGLRDTGTATTVRKELTNVTFQFSKGREFPVGDNSEAGA